MKLQFVGTGAIGAKERSACTLINNEILIDLGNGNAKSIKQLGHSIEKIKAVFITHLHGDHYADIPFLILDRMILKTKTNNELVIYGPEKLEENVRVAYEVFFDNYERYKNDAGIKFATVKESKDISVDKYEVTPYKVDHGKLQPAYGYIVKKDNKSVGFSGDSVYCKAIDEIVKKSDVSVLDMSSVKTVPGHMGMEDILKICEKYPEKTIIATHMHAETRIIANDLKVKNLIIPNDGDVYEF